LQSTDLIYFVYSINKQAMC